LSSLRGLPAAFHLMPPISHTERSVPQSGQRAIQARDSASMDAAQLHGTSDVNSLWMKLTT
jgi:hypothetical protein